MTKIVGNRQLRKRIHVSIATGLGGVGGDNTGRKQRLHRDSFVLFHACLDRWVPAFSKSCIENDGVLVCVCVCERFQYCTVLRMTSLFILIPDDRLALSKMIQAAKHMCFTLCIIREILFLASNVHIYRRMYHVMEHVTSR